MRSLYCTVRPNPAETVPPADATMPPQVAPCQNLLKLSTEQSSGALLKKLAMNVVPLLHLQIAACFYAAGLDILSDVRIQTRQLPWHNVLLRILVQQTVTLGRPRVYLIAGATAKCPCKRHLRMLLAVLLCLYVTSHLTPFELHSHHVWKRCSDLIRR